MPSCGIGSSKPPSNPLSRNCRSADWSEWSRTEMHFFCYRDGELYCEEVPLSRIAKEVGTPCYVYSAATLIRHVRAFDRAFASIPHLIAFAVKANSNLAILHQIGRAHV